MNWENYGGWHLDQPLCVKENISKSNKLNLNNDSRKP